MKLSEAYIPTQKEIPADAIIPSHQLMLRAGLIRLLASGIYSFLPLGWKIMQKIMNIIREEMNRIGGQELYLPVLNPIEIWDETGRNTAFGDEMFRLKDRKKRILALAPTHEEIICDLARKFVRSYKDMPQTWYQIQTKFRDEPRPRSGVIRARQFFMKDSYSLDASEEGLERSYQLHAEAYKSIFQRCGLLFHIVGASSGLMGGSGSQEFMLESEYGEDTLVLCENCDYAANMEIAQSIPKSITCEKHEIEYVHTPGQKTIEEVSKFLKKSPAELMKSLLFMNEDQPVMILIRGDHEVNELKLQSCLGGSIRSANPDEVSTICGAEIGFVGPYSTKKKVRIIADLAIQGQHDLTTGANRSDYHVTGLEFGRDIHVDTFIDIRNILPSEKCTICGGKIKIVSAIELGHIFKLGTKYSKSMNAGFLDRDGKEKPIIMGSYGIGVERIIAASIEQNKDEKGIVWDVSIAPYLVHIIPVKMDNTEIVNMAQNLYKELQDHKIETMIDDRKVSPGFKFKDADLLGMPYQVIIGENFIKTKQIDLKERKTGHLQQINPDTLIARINELTSQ